MSNANAAGVDQISNQNPEGANVGLTVTDLVSLYGVPGVVQPAGTGETTGHVAVGGTNVDASDTFTGNTGTAAYTINDIVKALKNLGALKA